MDIFDDLFAEEVQYRDLGFLGFPRYRVGNDGSVWGRGRWDRGEWIRKQPGVVSEWGHQQVNLYNGDTKKSFMVAGLILTAFVGPCPPGMEACHNDGNPSNNVVSNLRWDTHQNNLNDRWDHGTMPVGSKTKAAKLTEEIVKEMRDGWPTFFGTQVAYAKKYGISKELMNLILRRKTWKHV